MTGKIIKGIAGFYYVHDGQGRVYECKAKGVFRNRKIKPLVGDNVEFEILDDREATGNIVSVLERKNSLIRPQSPMWIRRLWSLRSRSLCQTSICWTAFL